MRAATPLSVGWTTPRCGRVRPTLPRRSPRTPACWTGAACSGTAPLGTGAWTRLCKALTDACPESELILIGAEEPLSLIHAPNESVDPAEIAAMALTEALFLRHYAAIRA